MQEIQGLVKPPARKKYRVVSPSGSAANNAIFFAGGFGGVADRVKKPKIGV